MMGISQHYIIQDRDGICVTLITVFCGAKFENQQKAKALVKMLAQAGNKVSLYTVERVLYQDVLKGHLLRLKFTP